MPGLLLDNTRNAEVLGAGKIYLNKKSIRCLANALFNVAGATR